MIRRIAVVVPAANEASSIEACLAALCAAADAVPLPVGIVVVLDGCTDDTAAIVAHRPEVQAVATSARNVGFARGVGAAHALRDHDANEVLLASTDADSQVPADWLTVLTDLSRSADVVLGTVLPGVGLLDVVERDWTARYAQHDGHPHVHAANLGIRGDAYTDLEGWRPLAVHEDVDLVARATAAGLRVHRTAAVPVRTSTRAIGRAPGGFSSYLRELGHA